MKKKREWVGGGRTVPCVQRLQHRKKSVSHLLPVIFSISPSPRFHCLTQPGLGTEGPHAQLVVKDVGYNGPEQGAYSAP